MKHPIPHDAFDDRLGFIGTSGSGKTYNSGTAVEILLNRKHRVVIIDPLGVWWGLRLLADGRKSGFDVAIFGGPHGDLPLTESAGALIGETAATMAESCIIDLSQLKSRAAERRFMVAFLETIYRSAGGEPFHLIVDEADLFAPQKPQAGDEVLLGHMENIVRRGRVKGFIPWLISQRPAVLNKNVLSMVDGLLAFKLTSPQDRDALDAWIEGQADKAKGKEIKDGLPTLQIGQGVVWLPGHDVLRTASFPQKVTFDSSRKLKRGEAKRTKALKPLDLSKLQERLATVEAEAKADNPKALRADIAKLRSEKAALEQKVSAAKTATVSKADKKAIEDAAEKKGFEKARKQIAKAGEKVAIETILAAMTELRDLANSFGSVLDTKIAMAKQFKNSLATQLVADVAFTPTATLQDDRNRHMNERVRSMLPPQTPPRAKPAGPIGDGDTTLTNPQLKLLQALAWWAQMGHAEPDRRQAAAIAGWKPTGSNLKDRLSELKALGLVVYPSNGLVALTDEGAAVAPAPDTGSTVIDGIRGVLTGPQLKLFDTLLALGREPVAREALAVELGWEPNGSNLKDRLSELKGMEIVTYPGKGAVQLQSWIDDGAA